MLGVIHSKIKQAVTGISFAAFCLALSNTIVSSAHASNLASANASVTVDSTCTMNAAVTSEHSATMVNGTYSGTNYPNGIGSTTMQTFCNDANGYAIYAIGYTNNEEGNTVLKGGAGLSSDYDIVTGTATSGSGSSDVSNWAMKVSSVAGTYAPTIVNGFNDFSNIPSSYTTVAKYNGVTDQNTTGSSITTTYAAYISNTQPAGTYTGQVKYVLVHPDFDVSTARTMQNIAEWEDELLPEVQVTAIDNRDNTEYTVAKMKDGNIWMTQNLDLCIGCTGTATLTSENTDLNQYDTNGDGTGDMFAGYSVNNGIITWTPSHTTVTGHPATITNYAYTGEANNSISGWGTYLAAPSMAEGNDTITTAKNVYYETTTENGITTTALQKCINSGKTEAFCKHNYVGNYYNFTAAVAMSNTSSYTADYTVMPNSVCPAGWRLPKGLTQTNSTINISEFNNLMNIYGVTGGNDTTGSVNVTYTADGFAKLVDAPLYYTRAGDAANNTLYISGLNGGYWTSTIINDQLAYLATFESKSIWPAYRNSRARGRAVRCLRESATMQTISKHDLNVLMPNAGDTTKIRDSRDDTEYTIGKLADGNYWMLDNLALDKTTLKSGVTLDSSNTNLSAGKTYTLPDSTTTGFGDSGYTTNAINNESKNTSEILLAGQSDTGKIGVYYNYCAASAGTYCMDSSSGSGNATSDICPKGWRLPTGGPSGGEFKVLRNQYASNAEFVLALRTPLAGYFIDGSLLYQGSSGLFWSSTYYNASDMYRLDVTKTEVYPQNATNRRIGSSVRCVKQ